MHVPAHEEKHWENAGKTTTSTVLYIAMSTRAPARTRAPAPREGRQETLENAGKTPTSTVLYIVMSTRAPARARARALCFFIKNLMISLVRSVTKLALL